jgi:hypothetical protein
MIFGQSTIDCLRKGMTWYKGRVFICFMFGHYQIELSGLTPDFTPGIRCAAASGTSHVTGKTIVPEEHQNSRSLFTCK